MDGAEPYASRSGLSMELAARDEESGFPLMCVCDHIINHSELLIYYEVGIMILISRYFMRVE